MNCERFIAGRSRYRVRWDDCWDIVPAIIFVAVISIRNALRFESNLARCRRLSTHRADNGSFVLGALSQAHLHSGSEGLA